jgi:ABC-2 type transport system permease protein
MINLAYMRLVWKNNRSFALFSLVFITLLQFLILYLVTTFDTKAIVSAIISQLPESMKAFLQDSVFSMLNYEGAAAFGFNHPLVLALLVITAVNIPVHHITRELDSGTLELILAHPFRRRYLIISLWISGCLIFFLIIAGAIIGSVTSIILFHHLTGEMLIHLIQIGINLWLFIILIFSYSTLIAVFGKMGSKAGNYSAIITLVFYLLSFLAQIWSKLNFIKPFNIFTYYEPQQLMFNKGHFTLDILVLCILILICFWISLKQFIKRDIP